MTRTQSPHDKLVKEFLSNRETAASLFDHYLPTDIRETLRLETLEICKDSFVEPEKHTALQVLGYIRCIWALHLEQATWPLPVIVPMVLYHGPRPWPYSTDLLSLIDGPDKRFLPYIPDFSKLKADR